MKVWEKYKELVWRSTPLEGPETSLDYWRDYLFRVILLYLIPFSLLALIPSFWVNFMGGFHLLILFDILAVFVVYLMGFTQLPSLKTKKILLIFLTNTLALALMVELGSFGPGLMYLVASGVFVALLFPPKDSWYSVFFGALICILFGLEMNYNFFRSNSAEKIDFVGWFAISVNVVFVNGVIAKVVPILFEKMHQSIVATKKMEEVLLLKQEDLNELVHELEIQNANLNQLIKGVSEDFQEPLRMMISFLGQLKRKYSSHLDEKANQYIDFATQGGMKMREIILGLLDLASVGKTKEKTERFEVTEVIQKVIFLQKKNILRTNAQIDWTDEMPVIEAPKTYLIQIFNELISNSLKFNSPHESPKIQISCQEEERWWQFSVRDNGIGFDDSDSIDPFVVFRRLHPNTEARGLGIGLALVRKISEYLRGSVWAESVPGEGSVFYLRIPKAA
ncbi:ATP-binding protein [Algoriphagus sp. AK58]|uniref:sensor histidine kinase n=1 Tax=Algoriphagus sp. AK58 TaxID=1406877 RepID=UPI0016502B3E|nr:ATP-binding protein [Algoriphagus sp. AK58]MBC6366258.1 hypothetical protein [Algoriphagus sp. AK58]